MQKNLFKKKKKKLTLSLPNKQVPIIIGNNTIFEQHFISFLKKMGNHFVIITDQHVETLFGNKLLSFLKSHFFSGFLISVPPSETSKTRKTKEEIENKMFQERCSKDTILIALGGGMICDLAAFVASTYMRGIPLLMIPTSLLAMLDASIGGKTAVNTPFGKNLIGSFYHPEAIFIDSFFLSTLPKKEYQNALSEIIKYSLIQDASLFLQLLHHSNFFSMETAALESLIYKCCLWKKKIIEEDVYDQKKREILNFGHTIGHILEKENLSHGDAIAIGMISASYLSTYLGFLEKKEFSKIVNIFNIYSFSLKLSSTVSLQELEKRLFLDKKVKNKKVRFVLLEKIGKVKTFQNSFSMPIDAIIIKKILSWIQKRFVQL